ncbi:syntaxin Vam3p [Diutina catenulata]
MSFANLDLEAQQPPAAATGGSAPASELDVIIAKTSRQLQVFSGLVSQFETNRKQVGTRRDTPEFREATDALVSQLTEMETAISKLLAQLTMVVAGADVSNRHSVMKERLVAEFHDLHKQLGNGVRLYTDKKKNYSVKKVSETTPLVADPESSGQQQQQQQQVQQERQVDDTELQYHIMLTEERNREIQTVSQGITEINSIFKDLGQLVQQQGNQLDTIEDHVLQLNDNAQQADRELGKANEYQRKKGKWSCILLVALSVVVLIIVLAVVS